MLFRKLAIGLSLAALWTGSVFANNLFVLPTFTGSATGTGLIYSGNPLAQVGTVTVGTDIFAVFSKPAASPGDTKYYLVSRSGSNSLLTLNSTFQPIGQPLSFGQNVTAAAMSPDGKRLALMAGNLRIVDTDTDQIVQTNFLDVGPTPNDLVFSADSKRVFVVSSLGQRVTGVDMTSLAVIGQVPLPGVTTAFIARSPNGFGYVSAQNRVLELNLNATPFDSNAVLRQFSLSSTTATGVNVSRLSFTPDGQRAVALNTTTTSGALLYYFSLDLLAGGFSTIDASNPSFTGYVFDKIFVAGNDRAYVTTAVTSANARKLFRVDLPAIAAGGTIPALTLEEAFFGQLGNVSIADQAVFSGEYPRSNTMYLSAPLNLLQPSVNNTIYAFNLVPTLPTRLSEVTLPFLPGAVAYAGPATNPTTASPGGIERYNFQQPALAAGAKTRPFGIRVMDVTGKPMFNVPVVFTVSTAGATLETATTLLTNAEGQVFNVATAPATAGLFSINVAVQGSGLTTTFTFEAASGSSGGGGGGGGGGTGSGSISVVSGNGQVVREGDLSGKEYVVRVVGPDSRPAAGVPVTWAITQGLGKWDEGEFLEDGAKRRTLTDSNGLARNRFRAQTVTSGEAFVPSVLTASTATGSVDLYATSYLAFSGGNQTPNPGNRLIAPSDDFGLPSLTGKAGQTLTGAIQIQVVAEAGVQFGAPMPNVGVFATTGNLPADGPVVECVPTPVALTNTTGLATCDLKLGGRSGTAQIRVDIGGFAEKVINLRVDPGEPGELRIVSGNNQTANVNENVPGAFVVQLGDGGGNTLSASNIRWEVIQGNAILANSVTITDTAGRASNTLRVGNNPGVIQVRATAVGGSQPSVTFEVRVNVTVSALGLVSGNNQRTFINTAFPSPLVVSVADTQGRAVPGQAVRFDIVNGTATLDGGATNATVNTDTTGRSQVAVRCGGAAGSVTVRASVPGLQQTVSFNLTCELPGPVINSLDFFNLASNARGTVSPGGLYRLQGSGIAPDLRGCVDGGNIFLGQLPRRIANVEVQFGSTLAPLFSVCNVDGVQTVTLQAPFELTPGFPVNVTVRVGSGSSVINNVQVMDMQPGMFETVDAQGRRYAVAVRPNGTFVTPENPARYNELIRVYLTGVGAFTPAAQTGAVGIAGQRVAAEVITGLNDAGVRTVSATHMVGFVGVAEVTLEIPNGTQTGAARPIGVILSRPNGSLVYPDNNPTIAIAP